MDYGVNLSVRLSSYKKTKKKKYFTNKICLLRKKIIEKKICLPN